MALATLDRADVSWASRKVWSGPCANLPLFNDPSEPSDRWDYNHATHLAKTVCLTVKGVLRVGAMGLDGRWKEE